MKRKFLICLLITAFFATSASASRFRFIFTPRTVNTFSEADREESFYCDTVGHWCNYAATRLHNEGIFTGMKIGNNYYFGAEEQVTRGEFLLYICAVLGIEPTDTGYAPFADFAAVPFWQKPAVVQMYNLGFVHGSYENGGLYFNSDESITRLEAAQILSNILNLDNSYKQTTYTDSYLVPKYASGAIKNVTDYGLMKGYDDKSFRPYIRLNRAMLAEILCNLKDYCEKKLQTAERLKNADKK